MTKYGILAQDVAFLQYSRIQNRYNDRKTISINCCCYDEK